MSPVLWIVLGVVAVLVLFAIVAYNRLVSLREQVRAGWAQIDVLLKRRHDLIPNVVETVKGYAAHERGTLEGVISARGGAVAGGGAVERRAEPAVRPVRGLPRPQGQRQLHGPAARAGQHGKPDRP